MTSFFPFFILLFFSVNASGSSDLSLEFKKIYHQKKELTPKEVALLKNFDIYFIPGIFAESLIDGDERSRVDLTRITKDYFGTQLDILQKKYLLSAQRITTSSSNVLLTQENIRLAVKNSYQRGRKVIFISHSLGGLALLEELIKNPKIQNEIAGIAFLQSPFLGSPLGDILLNPPYHLEKIVKPLLPLVNISPETVEYVSPSSRKAFMRENQKKVQKLIKRIPLYTFSSFSESNSSIFKPLIDIMEVGCVKGIKLGCITEVFYPGPYDKSDGLIPVKSSFLENADYVFLEKVDHGEIILKVPFEDYDKEHLTTTWLRILLQKITE